MLDHLKLFAMMTAAVIVGNFAASVITWTAVILAGAYGASAVAVLAVVLIWIGVTAWRFWD